MRRVLLLPCISQPRGIPWEIFAFRQALKNFKRRVALLQQKVSKMRFSLFNALSQRAARTHSFSAFNSIVLLSKKTFTYNLTDFRHVPAFSASCNEQIKILQCLVYDYKISNYFFTCLSQYCALLCLLLFCALKC